jgi:hypothetical protein
MLESLAPDIWHTQYHFLAHGVPLATRMTVVRLHDGALWLHSPIPLSGALRAQLDALGTVRYIVAPNKVHHLYAAAAAATYPEAQLYGPPGLRRKRRDLQSLLVLPRNVLPEWANDLDQVFFDGFPLGEETVWFHRSSRTLIVTDLCQWWQGKLPFASRAYARLTGVRERLAVPRTVRWLVTNRKAARASAALILQWPIERLVVAHNCVIERDALAEVSHALRCFTGDAE